MDSNGKVRRGLSAIATAALARDHRLAELAEQSRGLAEFRCAGCGRLLFEYAAPVGRLRISCRRCGASNELRTEPATTAR